MRSRSGESPADPLAMARPLERATVRPLLAMVRSVKHAAVRPLLAVAGPLKLVMARPPALALAFSLALVAGACSATDGEAGAGSGEEAAAEAGAGSQEALTRQQKDSIVGESRLPGAGVVRGAIDASEAARVRAEAHDSIP